MNLTTKLDLEREDMVAALLAEAWGCKVKKLGGYDTVDRLLIKDEKVKGVVEIKCRDVQFLVYPTLYLSVRKYIDLMRWANATRSLPFFVWGLNDGLYYWRLSQRLDGIVCDIKGRTDRGLENDLEPILQIPNALIKRVGPPSQEPAPIFNEEGQGEFAL